MIDLHCHSYFSDGELTPEQLIQKAQTLNLRYLSLTDHDTLSGYPELMTAAETTNVQIIPGIEFSTVWKKHEIHILAYLWQDNRLLQQLIDNQMQRRKKRAERIALALEDLGVVSPYQKACDLAGHQRLGRPHFAKLLVLEGRVRDVKAAFQQYLNRGKKAYVDSGWLCLQEVVAEIVASGGLAVIAHPLKYGLTRCKLHELMNDFKAVGGQGIEVVSGEMKRMEIKEMAAISMSLGLFASTGSDFHSDRFSRVALGMQQPLPDHCIPIWHHWTQGTTI